MSDDQKNELDLAREKAELAAKTVNESRTGVGTRQFVGSTRGRNTTVITYEQFDQSQPDTCPKSLKEFNEIVKADEAELLEYVIVGYNDALYKAASDEIGEFVNKAWDKETISQFRVVVRNLSKAMGKTIEEIVEMVKPGIEMAFLAKQSKTPAEPVAQ